MTGPLVGLSTYRDPAAWGQWHAAADLLPAAYADVVAAAGGVPLLLPPAVPDPRAAAAVVAAVDALVVTGGPDVDPARYGESPASATHPAHPARDAWELALLDAARGRGTPTLGICRGMQLLAVSTGGSLHQHLPDEVGHDRHRPGEARFGTLTIRLAADSTVGALLGKTAEVRCHHHQAVARRPGLRAVGWAEDGTVEAVEDATAPFCVGVQWHPEASPDAEPTVRLLGGLIAAASRHPGASRT